MTAASATSATGFTAPATSQCTGARAGLNGGALEAAGLGPALRAALAAVVATTGCLTDACCCCCCCAILARSAQDRVAVGAGAGDAGGTLAASLDCEPAGASAARVLLLSAAAGTVPASTAFASLGVDVCDATATGAGGTAVDLSHGRHVELGSLLLVDAVSNVTGDTAAAAAAAMAARVWTADGEAAAGCDLPESTVGTKA